MKVVYGPLAGFEIDPVLGKTADPMWNMGFSDYEESASDCYLFMCQAYDQTRSGEYDDKKKIFLTFEEPNFCIDEDGEHVKIVDSVDEILTICPYTADTCDKRTEVILTFNQNLIPKDTDKIWDVIYSGSVPGTNSEPFYGPWPSYMNVMTNYNYRYINWDSGTNRACTYQEKLDLYSQSKIALLHNIVNVLYPQPERIEMHKKFPNSEHNKAFDLMEQTWFMPQIKTITFEAAFSKCVMLCSRDPWNIIERYFEPEVDFLYFDTAEELNDLIQDILAHYDDYEHLTESAYNRAVNNYTTHHFIEKYIGFK